MSTRLRLVPCLCVVLFPLSLRGQEPRLVVQSAHADGVNAVAFSPDGKVVATASADQSIKLWHAASGSQLHTLVGFNDVATAVAFSHDGEFLVAASRDKTLRVWNAGSGQFLFPIPPVAGPLLAVAVSPDHKLIAHGGDGATFIYEVDGDKVGPPRRGFAASVNGLAFGPKGKLLAAACRDGTVKLLEAPGGRVLHTLSGHTQAVSAVAFSPDGKLLASAGEDGTVRLWQTSGPEAVFTLKGHAGKVNAVAFSPDGETLASGGEDRSIRFWDTATGKPRPMRFRDGATGKVHDQVIGLPHVVSSLAFGADGRTLVSGTRQHAAAALWHVEDDGKTVRLARLLHGVSDKVYAVAVAPDGKAIATGMNRSIALWRLGTARQLITIDAHAQQVSSVAFSPDGNLLVSGSLDRWIKLWDGHSGKFLHALPGHSSDIPSVAFSPDNKTVASAGLDRSVNLWHVRDGKLHPGKKLGVEGNPDQFFSVAFSPDGQTVLAGSGGHVRRWDAATGEARPPLPGDAGRYLGLAFARDGKTVAGACQDGSVTVWDAGTGKVLHHLITENTGKKYYFGCMEAVAFHPDGDVLVGGSDDRTIHFWNPATGKPLMRPAPRPGDRARPLVLGQGQSVKALAFTTDGKFLVSGSGKGVTPAGHGNGEVKLWSVPKAGRVPRLVCTLAAFADGSWAVVDPRGRYDASNGGDVPWLHFVSAQGEPTALKQLAERYYEPRLLDKLLGFNEEKLREVKPIGDLKPPPRVVVQALDPKTKQMKLQVTDQGGGVGRVQVFVNNKELLADAGAAKGGAIMVDLSKAPTLLGQGDEVRVVTWNADGDLAGRGLRRELEPAGAAPAAKPELYAIVAGVSTYKGARLNLRYAAKDAENMAQALETGGKHLFGAEKVHITLLTSSPGTGPGRPATKENFHKAFEAAARKARPQDIFVVFLAGHGLALPEEDLYCYLTQEAASLEPKDYGKADVRAATTVSSDELVEWIKQVPALKQVMLLDTCAAGAAVVRLTVRTDVSGRQIRAIEKLKDRTGFHVLMGCAADRVSYEATQYQQGLLTYALLEGMRGPALDEKRLVQVDVLFRYAANRVPELARDIGGVQQPLVSSPQSQAIAVGQLAAGDIKQPPAARPLLLKLRLLDPAVGDDHLELVAKLRERLGDAVSRGPGGKAVAVYVDADEGHDAIRPAGTYTVKDTDVTVKLVLRRNNKPLDGGELSVSGKTTDLDALADRIAEAVTQALPKP